MVLVERLKLIHNLFVELEITSSRNEKEYLISQLRNKDKQVSKDLDWCFEYLSGQHKLGYRVDIKNTIKPTYLAQENISLEEFVKPFYQLSDHSFFNIANVEAQYEGWGQFLNPLLNREWRLGVNRSQLEKTSLTPMLAKKFDKNKVVSSKTGYVITEKLDGNRCIAYFDNEEWIWRFISRSGKPLKVNFDMSKFDRNRIYDGEILSKDQLSNPNQNNFNTLSGIINSDCGNKNELIYMIFDIVDDTKFYRDRRIDLDNMAYDFCESENVKILPILKYCKDWKELVDCIDFYLETIVEGGGEGVMVNCCYATYQHKRTDQLLKYKPVYSMDMKVIDLIPGTGKNEGLVGSLECIAKDDKGNTYTCNVGSGIADIQRAVWADRPDQIMSKIVEVEYFSVSQDKNKQGSTLYSLRFPRLKRVRYDKNDTSVY